MNHLIAKFFPETSLLASLLLVTVLVLSGPVAGQESSAFALENHIPLPNVKGRIDHFSVDVKGQRLFVAAVDNHTLEVVDLKSGQRVHTITDLAEPQGVFYDTSTNHLFVACGLDGVTKIFDATTFQIVATVKFPDDADNIRYDARSKGVIVGYAGAKQLRKRLEGTGGSTCSPVRVSWKSFNRKIPITMTGSPVTLHHLAHKPVFLFRSGGNSSQLYENKVSRVPNSACIRHTKE